jgi:hypothetical protein
MPDGSKTISSPNGIPEAPELEKHPWNVVVNIPWLPAQTKSKVEVTVIFTTFELTRKAVKNAGALAMRAGARIAVVAAQVVRYPLPLDQPPVPYGFIFRRFEAVVEQLPVKTEFRVFLCRDQLQCLKSILSIDSPIVMGVRKRFWPTRDERLAHKLRRAGYDVTLIERE